MPFFSHVGIKNVRLSPGLAKSPLEITWDGQVTWREVRTEQFRCAYLTSWGRDSWEPFNCTMELASWTMKKNNVKVEIVVLNDDLHDEEFGEDLGLDDSIGVSYNLQIRLIAGKWLLIL